MRLSPVLALSVLALSSSTSLAVDASVPFAGTVLTTCVLTVGTPGVLASDATFTSLASTNAGGAAGSVTALATGSGYKVSALAPTAFTASPTGGGDNVTFSASYSGTGSTSIGVTPGATPTTLATGTTILSVDMNAQKTSGTFAGGAYSAVVTVRCE